MHLEALRPVKASIPSIDMEIRLAPKETIHTEVSRKFSRKSAEAIFADAGFSASRWYTDSRGWFSLVELQKSG